MNRRQSGHVAAILAVAILARATLFHVVGVWGDAGFYTYDAMLINEGLVPFVDFVGRSPLFNYAYASIAAILGIEMATLRSFIVLWWLLAGIPVYAIGRAIQSHRTGLVALALFELSPFMLVYGYWANTQSLAAFLAVSGVAVILYNERWHGYALAGGLLGLAFLSRRSAVTILGAVGLYALYLGYRDRDLTTPITRGMATVAGFGTVLAAAYLTLAGFDPTLATKFAETHAWGLISSSGRGGFPLITDAQPPDSGNTLANPIPVFNDVCQLCGAWTARVFVKTTVASVIVVGPLLYYVRDGSERFIPRELHWWVGWGAFAIAVYASLKALLAGYTLRIGAVVSLVLFGYVVARTRLPSARTLYGRQIALPILCALALAAGYLYRNRLIHTYYFADFVPYVAVIAAVCFVHLIGEVSHE